MLGRVWLRASRRLNRDRMCAVRLASRPLVQLARHHGFRCLGLCAFFHSIGMVGEQVVLGWYILELTDSAFMVGLALGVRNLPLLFAGIPAGVVADRGDRVRLLRASGFAMAIGTALLGLLVAVRLGGVGPALILTFVTGCARARIRPRVRAMRTTSRAAAGWSTASPSWPSPRGWAASSARSWRDF